MWEFFADAAPHPITGKRRQRTRTFRGGERQAESALIDFVAQVRQENPKSPDATIEYLIEEWVRARQDDWEPNTLRGYRSKIDTHIVPNVGKVRIDQCTPRDFAKLYANLRAKGQSANSVRRVHAILRAAFGEAVEWEWITKNPVARAKPPRVELEEPTDLAPDVVAKAIRTAPAPLNHIAYLAAVTGAREAELCGLRWTDLNVKARTLRIQRRVVTVKGGYVVRPLTKTRTLRAVGLDARTVALLRVLRMKARQRARACGIDFAEDGFVFSETPDGKPLSANTVSQRWYRHRERLGLSLTFHQLRHFMTSALQDEGVQPSRVSKRVGHSRNSTTADVYTHVLRASDHDLAQIMAEKLREK